MVAKTAHARKPKRGAGGAAKPPRRKLTREPRAPYDAAPTLPEVPMAMQKQSEQDLKDRRRLIASRAKFLNKQRQQVEFLAQSDEIVVTGSTWETETDTHDIDPGD
jgi:hypothetical protein